GLESTLTILGHRLREGRIAVARNYDPALPRVWAAGGELNQVWTELIDNAVDAIGGFAEDGGWIGVRTALEPGRVLVEVADDGPGIPPDVLPRIWEPFFTTKGVGAGTGLGLDTVRRTVVERHGGDVRVESRPGETRFQVRLPLSDRLATEATTGSAGG
ncbi:MAG: sensor histidine kinase, partial [uncultured Thermomicrobiales bacterium]